jgi:catechol 2,3-dioxygenase-like lactoylglutathione lyase family enzyme
VRILGLVFAGTSTPHRTQMADFLRGTLSLSPAQVDGVEADLFELPDGSTFAVASPGGMGETPRSIGFLVDDLDAAAAELREAGVTLGPLSENEHDRYMHFHAPDGQIYELVEHKQAAE